MQVISLVEEVAVLAAADPACADRGELADLVARSQRVRAWLDAYDARIALAASRLNERGGCEPAEEVLGDRGRRPAREAKAITARAVLCDALPGVHDALAAGAMTAGHADALARTHAELSDTGRSQLKELESSLVERAAKTSVKEFEKEVRELGRGLSGDDGLSRHERLRRRRTLRRWIDRTTGMCHTHLELDPETDAAVSAALDDAVAAQRAARQPDDARTWDQLQVDAFVALITRRDGATGTTRAVPVGVLIDLDTLRYGLHDRGVCETRDGQPVPPDVIRRMACDAEIIPIVFNRDGVVVDVGRANRLATTHQRNALRAMHATCAYPHCTVRFADCAIHHVQPWEHGGATDLANMIPLCSRHHHVVHDGGRTITVHPDRTVTVGPDPPPSRPDEPPNQPEPSSGPLAAAEIAQHLNAALAARGLAP